MTAGLLAGYRRVPHAAMLLSGVALVNRSATMVLPFLSLYLVSVGWSPTRAGAALSLYGIAAVIGIGCGGWLSDRIGPTSVQAIALGAAGFVMLLLGAARSEPEIFAGVFAAGFFAEAFRPANSAAIAAACDDDTRPVGLALNRVALHVGLTIGPAAGGLLASWSYTSLFVVNGLGNLAAAVLVWQLSRDRKQGVAPAVAPAAPEKLARDPLLFLLLPAVFVYALVLFQIYGAFPIHLQASYGAREVDVGLLFGLNALLIVLCEVPLVSAVSGRRPLAVVAVGMALVCLGFGSLGEGSSLAFAAAAVAIWTIGEMLSWPILEAHVLGRAPESARGRYAAILGTAFALAYAVGPGLGMALLDRAGGAALWRGVLAIGVVLALWLALLARNEPAPPRAAGVR